MVLEILQDWTATQYLSSAVLLSVATWIISSQFSSKNHANGKRVPGSMGWPILGHLPYLDQANPYPIIDYYTKKYGPIFRLQMGSLDAVVLTDYHMIKKAFNHPDMTQRPKILGFEINSSNYHGLVLSNGPLWQEQRRFALRQLRDLGMGKASIETHIQREISTIIEGFKGNLGNPVDLNTDLNIAITNIVWAIITGKRLEYDDPKFIKMVNDLNKRIELLSSFGPVTFIPWLTKIFPDSMTGIEVIKKELKSFMDYLEEVVEEHRASFDPNDPRDYIDYFLIEQMNNPDSTFTNIQLKASINDLFIAGGETTATTLRWAVLLIGKQPEVMKKLQEEIDTVVGRDRLPCLEDQSRMPYTAAVIQEVQRYSDLVPLGVLHSSEKDIDFEGFHIPQDTIVIGVHGHSHRSTKYWAKPYEFYPEHFLEPDGQLRQNVEGFFPFSTGKRICLGERLARAELFLFTTHFYHQFNIRLAEYPIPSLEADPRSATIRWPSPYKAIMTQRT